MLKKLKDLFVVSDDKFKKEVGETSSTPSQEVKDETATSLPKVDLTTN